MNKDLIAIFEYMEREKGIKRDIIVSAIEESLQAAAQKHVDGNATVNVQVNSKTGDIETYCEKEIVEIVEYPAEEISLEAAKELDADCELGQYIDILVTPEGFGRIAARKAQQVIAQRLRTAERDVIHDEYRHRINDLVTGVVKRSVRGNNLIVDLGKVEALLPNREYPRDETYSIGNRILCLLLEVQEMDNGGARVILSRNHVEFVKRLFEREVPELSDGIVSIKDIVREPGYRSKLVVESSDPKVDPVGACVGMRGSRIKNVIRELENEKIDIIPYVEDPVELLQNALSPIEIHKVRLNPEENTISIVVDDEDFALVLGKKGWNARLNGALVKQHLEVLKLTEYKKAMAVQRLEIASSDDPDLDAQLSIEGLSDLVVKNLIAEGLDTARKVLSADIQSLIEIPGITLEMADLILEQITKERA